MTDPKIVNLDHLRVMEDIAKFKEMAVADGSSAAQLAASILNVSTEAQQKKFTEDLRYLKAAERFRLEGGTSEEWIEVGKAIMRLRENVPQG